MSATELPVYDASDLRPARATPPPIVEHVMLVALFAGWAGFWIAVIWWIVA